MKKINYKKYTKINEGTGWRRISDDKPIENYWFENWKISQKEKAVFRNCIFVNGKEDGLQLLGSGSSFFNCVFAFNKRNGISIGKNAYDIKFYDCFFSNNGEQGAVLNHCKDVYFYNCTFEENEMQGISLLGKNMLRSCIIKNNKKGIGFYSTDCSDLYDCKIIDNKICSIQIFDKSSPIIQSTSICGGKENIVITDNAFPVFESCEISGQKFTGICLGKNAKCRLLKTKIFDQIPLKKFKEGLSVGIGMADNAKLFADKCDFFSTTNRLKHICIFLLGKSSAQVTDSKLHDCDIAVKLWSHSSCLCSWCKIDKENYMASREEDACIEFRNC